ncbi:MAG TPA: NAD-binding protein [Thermomicrobiales bacterium]|nr:NAD-binding protein [Thermomicrobiales bacterium]
MHCMILAHASVEHLAGGHIPRDGRKGWERTSRSPGREGMYATNQLPRLGVLRLPEGSPVPAILRRIGLAIGLIVGAAVVLWIDRDGLRDHAHDGRPLGFTDVFYYTVISLTTVGYGAITPFTQEARLINAFLLTPIRIFLWALFLGTAYELTLLRVRLREEYQMRQLHERLDRHVVICGYGVKGRAIVSELLAHGHSKDAIIIIDPEEDAVAAAAATGLAALRGDAAQEAMLTAAAVSKAADVLVAPNRDDAAVLICLTVRSLAPKVRLVASARQEENVKLLYGAGADLVVAPSVSGGRLMAAAVRQQAVPQFLEDILTFGHGMGAAERVIGPDEAGRLTVDLPDLAGKLVLGVARGTERCPFNRLADFPLQPGDVVVYLTDDSPCVEDVPIP